MSSESTVSEAVVVDEEKPIIECAQILSVNPGSAAFHEVTPEIWFGVLSEIIGEEYKTEFFNSTLLLDKIHDILFNRYGLSMDLLITPQFFHFCTQFKIFPSELSTKQIKTIHQTSISWLLNKQVKNISIPPATPKSVLMLMIVYQYAKLEMFKHHPVRRLLSDQTNKAAAEEFKKYFSANTKVRNEKEKSNAQTKAIMIGLFFIFYIFLILHELQYECKDRDVMNQDMQASSIWTTHLELFDECFGNRKGMAFSCFGATNLIQQLMPLVFELAVEWKLIQTAKSTLSLIGMINPSASSEIASSGESDDENSTSEDASEYISDKEQSQEFGHACSDNENNNSKPDSMENVQHKPRGKNVVYMFERIPRRNL